MPLRALLDTIAATPRCIVHPRAYVPSVEDGAILPDDLRAFYETCGGGSLFEGSSHSVAISGPDTFVRSNLEILGEEFPDDISHSWRVVARVASREAISIDCHPDRLGRCYDSFWDTHGVAGSCAIVALSFTELLTRLFADRGARLYWTEASPGYGDAYMPTPARS